MRLSVILIVFLSVFSILPITIIGNDDLRLEGINVVPHVQSHEMRYRKKTDFSLGARVQVFVRNTSSKPITLSASSDIRLRGHSPQEIIKNNEWSWHNFPNAYPDHPLELYPNTLTVWKWNGNHSNWGTGTEADLSIHDNHKKIADTQIEIGEPDVWVSSITFWDENGTPFPNKMVFHIANHSNSPLTIDSYRLWLPESNTTWRTLHPQAWKQTMEPFPKNRVIPTGERGGAIVQTGDLPLTYTALEVRLKDQDGETKAVWGYLRIKREVFDISGGWVGSNINGKHSLTLEPYLKTLKRMHINTGHIAETSGYTDNLDLYSKYPLKYFHKLAPTDYYDINEKLPRIHAVEFLGEPQYGGGTPVAPMKVWQELSPYQPTRLATTVTHSEERIWRFYAGLSDYPHYDAYRITAPSADHWLRYDRWGEDRIRWGAPLETIGTMTRSLRDINRPMPIAYWSQGAHDGWGRYGGRERTSPSPNELRAQAYHALATRITSLYWFNLSLKSILKFPDLIQPITEIGREIRLLEDFYVQGDAYHYERLHQDNSPDWDVSVVSSPIGTLLFAIDLDYKADLEKKVFLFKDSRQASIEFPLPIYQKKPRHILQVQSNNISPVQFKNTETGVRIDRDFKPFSVFVVTHDSGLQNKLESKLNELIEYEQSFEFDPANNPTDLKSLQNLLNE